MKSRVLMSHRARRLFIWIHLWLGLGLGAWFSAIGLSGSVLAWRGELSAWELSRRFPIEKATGHATLISLTEATQAMKGAHPAAKARELATVTVPNSRMPFYSFSLGRDRASMQTVLIDPYSAKVHPPVKMRTLFVGTVNQFHSRLIAGMRGYLVNGFLTALAIPLLLSGLWLWWPTKVQHLKARLKVKRGVSLKRTMYDAHNVMGIYVYAILFVTTVTGALLVLNHVREDGIAEMWNTSAPSQGAPAQGRAEARTEGRAETPRGNRVLDAAAPNNRANNRERAEESAPKVTPQGNKLAEDELVAVARRLRPSLELARVKFPQRPTQTLEATYNSRFGMQRTQTVYINPYSGLEVVAPVNERNSAYNVWTRGLHFGEFGGILTKSLYTIAGLIPLGLFLSGFWLWWNKKRRKRSRDTTTGVQRELEYAA